MNLIRRIPLILNLGLLALLLSACLTPTPAQNIITPTSGAQAITQTPGGSAITQTPGGGGIPAWGKRTKTSGCKAVDVRPDPACTPGDVLGVAKDDICKSGYSSSVRNVTEAEKNAVYVEYGVATHNPGEYEVDHFVSLELGGSNDISNLWPEPAAPKPGFHEKDKVENYLHEQACTGALTLQDAQVKIATNWLAVYNQMPNK